MDSVLHQDETVGGSARQSTMTEATYITTQLPPFAKSGPRLDGVSPPYDEDLLFRQKDPKPLAPGRGPIGAFAPVPFVWAAELVSLRQSSPLNRLRDRGAATPEGADEMLLPQ